MSEARSPGRARSRLTVWLWVTIGIVLLVTSAPYWIGATLGEEYVGHARAVLSAPPEKVWSAIADFRSHPLGGSAASTVGEVPGEGALPTWLEDHSGRSVRITTLAREPLERMELAMADDESDFTARWTIELEPRGAETEVLVHQTCTVGGGLSNAPLRFVMRFMKGARLMPRSYLEELALGLGVDARFGE